jgi:predicted membrane-bound mannosyltransferase
MAWLAVLAVGVGVRLINLDGAPLQPNEAQQALDSWRILRGLGVTLTPDALFTYLNVLLFFAFGATDAVARMAPAVAGSAVVVSPLFLRRQLGQRGALCAGAVLATSPTLVFASRTADGTMLAVTLGLAGALLLADYAARRRSRSLVAAGIALALALMAGPAIWSVVVGLLGFGLWYLWERRRPVSTDAVDSFLHQNRSLDRLNLTVQDLRAPTIAFGVTVLVVGTGVGTHLAGLGDSVALPFGTWWQSLGAVSWATIWVAPAALLAYEPLPFLGGIAGAVVAIRRRSGLGVYFAWWAGLATLASLVSNSSHLLWLTAAIVPLAFLVGLAIDNLPLDLSDAEHRRRFGGFAAVTLSLCATAVIALGNTSLPDPNVPRALVLLPPVAIVMFLAGFALWYDLRSALASAAAVGVVVLTVLQLHAMMQLNPGGPLNPAELYVGVATSPDVRTMADDDAMTLDELHIARVIQGRPVTEDVQILAAYANPLAWYLHDQANVRIVSSPDGSPAIAIVGNDDKAPKGPYAGETFELSSAATVPGSSWTSIVRWWLYREPTSQTDSFVKVFVKTQLAQP